MGLADKSRTEAVAQGLESLSDRLVAIQAAVCNVPIGLLSASRDPSAPGRALLLALLGRRLRIVIADGRRLIGKFACTDRHSNIILRNADEYSPEPAPTVHADTQAATLTRSLGMIVIPGKHIRSVAVLEEGAQKVSGP